MLTEGEIITYAFKDLLFHEEALSKKYAELSKNLSDPQLLQTIQGMEQAVRTRYSMLSEKMRGLGIV